MSGLTLALAGILLARRGPLDFPWSRSTSANLVARRRSAGTHPRLWLVAHLDSKSQTIPMLLRIASLVAFAALFAGMIAVIAAMMIMSGSLGESQAHELMHVAFAMSLVAAVSLLPLMFCFIGNRPNGALDNASGVAAVLLAARMVPDTINVGIVITSAEELALAGARAFVRDHGNAPISSGSSADIRIVALNCDTIDEVGRYRCMAKGGFPRRLKEAVDRAAARIALQPKSIGIGKPRTGGMLPGILADNIAFTDGGWEAFTLSRGNLRTLARVHTSNDRAVFSMTGTGIELAARLIAATAEELSEWH